MGRPLKRRIDAVRRGSVVAADLNTSTQPAHGEWRDTGSLTGTTRTVAWAGTSLGIDDNPSVVCGEPWYSAPR